MPPSAATYVDTAERIVVAAIMKHLGLIAEVKKMVFYLFIFYMFSSWSILFF